MKLSNALLVLSGVAVAAGHPSVRGGGSDDDALHHRRLFPGPPATCDPFGPYQPCCGASPCWCDLDADGSSSSTSSSGDIDTCPDYPSQGIYLVRPDIIGFFASLTLDNSDYDDLCQPDLSNSVNLQGNSIPQGLLNALLPAVPPCDAVRGNKVCGIQFKRSGVPISPDEYVADCNPSKRATSYEVEMFNNKNLLKKAGFFVLHEGDCGVCSTAKDLATYMTYSFPRGQTPPESLTLSQIPGICFQFVVNTSGGGNPQNIPPKMLVDEVNLCLQGLPGYPTHPLGFGFTPNCAEAWAINTFFSGLPNEQGGCFNECAALAAKLAAGGSAYDQDTCELDDCLVCDDGVNGDLFDQLAGMTRRGAGIHTVLPRPCGSLADVTHTCVAEMT